MSCSTLRGEEACIDIRVAIDARNERRERRMRPFPQPWLQSHTLGLALLLGSSAKRMMDEWPAALLQGSVYVHVFSVLEWNTD